MYIFLLINKSYEEIIKRSTLFHAFLMKKLSNIYTVSLTYKNLPCSMPYLWRKYQKICNVPCLTFTNYQKSTLFYIMPFMKKVLFTKEHIVVYCSLTWLTNEYIFVYVHCSMPSLPRNILYFVYNVSCLAYQTIYCSLYCCLTWLSK